MAVRLRHAVSSTNAFIGARTGFLSESVQKKDFFVSRNGADAAWAEWIAGVLEDNGYTTVLQDWDFKAGQNFVQQMQKAITESERTIAVLSPQYLGAEFTQSEWQAAFRKDAKGEEGSLIPVIVQECEPPGLLSLIAYIKLVDKPEAEARRLLLDGVERGRAKRTVSFPGSKAAPGQTARRFPGALPEIFRLPHQRNPNFTGRDDLLRDLRATLAGGESAALTQAAIHGLGGVGKSQLAIEYVYRYAAEYSLVWWLRSEGAESLNADYEALAKKLGLVSEDDRPEQAQVVEMVREELEHRSGWLLVFDNAPDPKGVTEYLPRGAAGDVLITSRYAAWGGVAKAVSVKVWAPAESIQFLLRRTGQSDEAAAGELAEALGHLPLALEQAAAYIEEAGRSLAGYLELFRQHKLRLFETDSKASQEEATVTTTWEISFQQVRKDSSSAADLLHLCAFLGPDDIPLDMIVAGAERLPKGLRATVSDPLDLDKAIKALRSYSLLEVGGEKPQERGLSIHRLVQAVTRERLPQEEQKAWAEAAARAVSKAFPEESNDVRNWPVCARLSPHATQAADHAENLQVGLEAAGYLLNQLGLFVKSRAELERAKGYYERALILHGRAYGPEHSEVATVTSNIGSILKAQGDLPGALEYTKRALAIGEKAYGPDHPTVAIRANNIGSILKDQGDLPGALEYTKRALAIDEKAYGPDHPEVAKDANNIGQILLAQGDLPGALEYTKRALAINEKAYGPEHPTVAIHAGNTGKILRAQGHLAGALEYSRRALTIFERAYGPDHPHVATAAGDIGQILKAQGDLPGALEYIQRALAIHEKAYGLDHPNVAIDANNIGGILQDQGDLPRALEWVQRSPRILESTYGVDNPTTKTVARNLEGIREAMK